MKFVVGSVILLFLSCSLTAVVAISCIQCDSRDDIKCVVNPETFFARSCAKPENTKCYVRILDGRTVRGCVSDLEEIVGNSCGLETNCMSCAHSEQCNNLVFPEHRPRCMQCEGTLNSTCATNSYGESDSPCPLYHERDTCIIRKSTKKNEFIRGCLSSYVNMCKNKMCFECQGNGCNFITVEDPKIPDSASSVVGSIVLTFIVSAFLVYFK